MVPYSPDEIAADRALRQALPRAWWDAMDDHGVTDLDIDEHGRIWIKRAGRYPDAPDATISADAAFSVATVLSKAAKVPLGEQRQSLKTPWPGFGFRTVVVLPPASKPQPSVHVRTKWGSKLTGADLIASGTFTANQWRQIVGNFRLHENVIFTGLPGSGKTTAERAATLELAAMPWLVMIVDGLDEIETDANNIRRIIPNGAYDDYQALDDALVRDPGAIAYGEVRTASTLMALIRVWLTGVGGGFAAMHTDDCFGVLVRAVDAYRELRLDPVYSDIARVFRTIAHMRQEKISETRVRYFADEVVAVTTKTPHPTSLSDFILTPIP